RTRPSAEAPPHDDVPPIVLTSACSVVHDVGHHIPPRTMGGTSQGRMRTVDPAAPGQRLITHPPQGSLRLALDISSIGFFLAGFFLGNGMPHFIFGRAGKIFRSPFGQKSKPRVNVLWGLANFLLATVIIAGLDIPNEV